MKDTKFKAVAYVITVLFALVILFPLIYVLSNSMKDSASVYDIPPRLIPSSANSVLVTVDYTDLAADMDQEQLLQEMQQDHITAMMSCVTEMQRDSVFEVKFYGTVGDSTVYYARAHRAQIDLEKDNGVFRGAAITTSTLAQPNRWKAAVENLGYTYDPAGLSKYPAPQTAQGEMETTVSQILTQQYPLAGEFTGSCVKQNNWLLPESFIHYWKLPSYIYNRNEIIARYSFLAFFFNTALVLAWAVLTQVVLCALTAFPLSRLLSKKTSNRMLLFFLGSTMIPFVAVMVPQLTMFREMGFYNNYAALLLPHLLPYGFFVYLYKGFFDNLPGSLFEAARIDGAGNFYMFFKICMPLSKPIISVIALQTFLANWNDFFWAWLVTEKQSLWTMNVALYNISKVSSVKTNFVMGLSALTIIPVLLITILFSNQIKESIATAGIKG